MIDLPATIADDARLSNAGRTYATFGYFRMPLARMLDRMARGGRSPSRVTTFAVRDGTS